MRPTSPPTDFARLTIGARVFALLVLAAPLLWFRNSTALLALLAVGAIWLAVTAAERLRVNASLAFCVEAALVGTVCALSIDSSLAVLGSLAVPPFTAGLRRGPRGVALALSAELVALVPVSAALYGRLGTDAGTGAFTWILTGLGLGLIGSFLHSSLRATSDPLSPYREAQSLIRELIDLSGGLSSGLDPVALGGKVAKAVRDELPVAALAVLVPRGEGLTPLVTDPGSTSTTSAAVDALDALALNTLRTARPARSGAAFAFPLMTDAGLVAVVAGVLPERLEPEAMHLEGRLDDLVARLEPTAVHLDTALLFCAFRDSATANERRRVSREMHDGIAQDIVSLGYHVDRLVAQSASPDQAEQLRQLRARVTGVVAEVRQSMQSLRIGVGASESLGTAIGALARRLSEGSGIPILVTADERTARLRPDVEAELLRIAQEAMTNAVKHAQASLIDVRCRVDAPRAEIVVRDDGTGLRPGRPDSQGMEVMRERAVLVEADLTIADADPHGTVVTVHLPGTHPPAPTDDVSQDQAVTA